MKTFLSGLALFSHLSFALGQAGVTPMPAIRTLFTSFTQAHIVPDSTGVGVKKDEGVNKAQLKACCQKIVKDIQRIYYLNSRNGKVKLQVRGIYTRDKALFFALKLVNRSSLDYDVDSIRFFIAEKQKGRHLPLRLTELSPLYVYDTATQVKGFSRVTSVIVLPRFTLARHRRLQIEVLEKNGGRQLLVQAANFTLETARRT